MDVSLFLNSADSQFIDESGKTRMLIFGNVTMYTSPLPPFSKPLANSPINTTKEGALDFIENLKFRDQVKIIYQDGIPQEKQIQGIWLDFPLLTQCYIPIEPEDNNEIPDIPYTPEALLPPLIFEKESELSDFRRDKRIAMVLKQHILFLFAMTSRNMEKLKTDDNFLASLIKVSPDFDAASVSKLQILDINNNLLFQKGKLIVPTESLKSKLVSFLKTKLMIDQDSVLNFSTKKVLDESVFSSISDFRNKEDQILFMDRASLKEWNDNRDELGNNIVKNKIDEKTLEPYFYKNVNIFNGSLVIIQNVEGESIQNAVAVSKKWKHDKINIGFYPAKTNPYPSDIIKKEIDVANIFYTNNEPMIKDFTRSEIFILCYSFNRYAAILKI